MALQINILERMFEDKGYGFDPETDGFYPSTLPSFPEQPASSRELNRNVYEAFVALQQAHVVLADAVTEWDMADAWAVDGGLNASAWLRNKLGVSNGSANSMLTFARRTSLLAPSVREAVREGVLSTDKANQILYCFTKKRAEHVDRDVDMLIHSASQLTVNQTRLMMINWAATVDAEIESASGDIEPEDATIENELFISETIDGMTVMQGQFDAEVGETIRTAIDLARRLENGTLDELDKPTDHEGIENDSNDRATADEKPVDERNCAEQRADALGLIARFFLDHHNGLGTNAGERPHVQINIDLNTLQGHSGGIAETQHGNTGLTREMALRICCDAKIGRIITRGVSETFDVGRLTRAVPAPTAKAVRKRDKCCRFPGCDLSYRFTEIHHYVHWVLGGETNVSNLFLLCWRHHRMIHRRGNDAWTVTGNPNTILTFKAPNGDTYKTGPPGLLIPA
jgi:Domain of unknown function (DUF222)/HNH endonuclease